MIHDDLVGLFERTPQPSLSPQFSANLHRRLHAGDSPHDKLRSLPAWSAWLYWVVAAVVLARYWRPAMLTPMQMMVLAMASGTMLLTLKRATRAGSLIRVLRRLTR